MPSRLACSESRLTQTMPALGRLPLTLDRIEASVWPSFIDPALCRFLARRTVFTLDDYIVNRIMQR